MLPSRRLPASRRVVVLAAVALVLAVGGAVAFGLVGGSPTVLDDVPDEADVVVRIDPAVVDDERTRRLATAALEGAGFQSVDAETVLAAVQFRTGLSADGVHGVVAYGRYDARGRPAERYVGAVVRSNWSTDAVVAALESATGSEYRRTATGAVPVYRPTADGRLPHLAVVGRGEFVVGTRPAVTDAVAVARGNAVAVDGELREAMASTRPGLVTFAARVSPAWTEGIDARTRGVTRIDSIRTVAGAYDTTAGSIVLRLRLRTNGTEAARDVSAFTRGGLAIAASRLDNGTTAALLDAVAVHREGTDVAMAVETNVDDLRRIAAHYGLWGVLR